MRDWGAERKYEHDSWGGNYRMQTIQSAFLNIKFPFLTEWTAERKKLADFYTNSLPVKFLRSKTSGSGDNVYHIFDLLIEDRDKFITFMKQNGVSTAIHYPRAIHQHNAYKHLVVLKRPCDQAIIQVRKTVSIPLFPGLTINEQQTIINLIHEYHIYAH
jgi:dTDP-4-amino-4,6-dideoxygalactose transaminase